MIPHIYFVCALFYPSIDTDKEVYEQVSGITSSYIASDGSFVRRNAEPTDYGLTPVSPTIPVSAIPGLTPVSSGRTISWFDKKSQTNQTYLLINADCEHGQCTFSLISEVFNHSVLPSIHWGDPAASRR